MPAVCVGRNAAEPVAEAIRRRSELSGCMVKVVGLRKEFSTPGGTKVAVAGLNLAMYEGQVLTLLGHNGAGKSTTMHMLTGMVEPSAGDAVVAGHSLLTGMREIREVIGVCPQHDVLWQELTVLEHLRAYARLRGVDEKEVESRSQEIMQQVGLVEKAMTRAGSLSGGQKRKLSLCLALIGKPPVVFLDEPTSGMDPYSRRSTWNVIRAARDGRVIVLTTHFMDEADILGDRIAIMAEGVLQCCGSSLFLKGRFGAGYRITCARKQGLFGQQDVAAEIARSGQETITDIIMKHVPEAELLTDVGAELSIRLPSAAAGRFPQMLAELDAKTSQLGLEHYGLSMVTLEEVFLRVASGEMETLDRPAEQFVKPKVMLNQEPALARSPGGEPEAEPMADACDSPNTPQGSAEAALRSATAADANRGGALAVACRHFGALFMKRARYGHRDLRSMACTILLPVLLLAFGLWVLQVAGNPQVPSMSLDLQSQFGPEKVPVPFNASISLLELGNVLRGGGHLVTEPIPDISTGTIFGRNYSDGLPVYVLCDPGKCHFENTLCRPGNVYGALQALQHVGMSLDCNSNATDCQNALANTCQDGLGTPFCVQICLSAGAGTSQQVCQQSCNSLCGQEYLLQAACVFLGSSTFSAVCPLECASYNNPATCAPLQVCDIPSVPIDAEPSVTLSFEQLLFQQGLASTLSDVRYGAFRLSYNDSVGVIATLLYNTSAPHALPVYYNTLISAMKEQLQGPGNSISVANHPMPLARSEVLNEVVSGIVNLSSTFVIIIAFSWIPAAIVAYIVREREAHHNSKHQQLLSGVSLFGYWSANWAWDLAVYTVPLGLSCLLIWLLNVSAFVQGGALTASCVVFVGYGLAIGPFTYLLSFAFSKHTTAQVLCLVFNFLTGLLLMLVSFILNLIESTQAVNKQLMVLYRLFPGFCLGHGLFEICTNSVLSNTLNLQGHVNLLAMDIAGTDCLWLFVSAPIYFLLAVSLDYVLHSPVAVASRFFDPSVRSAGLTAESLVFDDDDSDVADEASRVQQGGADQDVIRLVKLRKIYRTPEGTPKVAVHGLSFGLHRGECFGFLGINGAGKTSTLNMLTGAVLPSGGNAYLGGHDVVTEQWRVRRLLGYCPQHDALLDRLTVREHLELFGRIKGIPRGALRGYCDAMMRDLQLAEHVDKLAMTLSGGNKRKLSLAISLMGAPPLVLLDEPSTGVDPAARRLMWNVISAVSTARRECCVMLTTHNMEEAEALCTRIGIMVGGRLRCIGSNQRLKARYGQGYQLEARLRNATLAESEASARQWRLPRSLLPSQISPVCSQLERPERVLLIREGCEEGYAIYEALEREGAVLSSHFAEWWLLEDRAERLAAFLSKYFEGTITLERHERTIRYRLPEASSLAEVFEKMEGSKAELCLEEYGVSQTSLEQIFNDFAAKQHEETSAVRGLYVQGRSIQGEVETELPRHA